MTVNWIIEIALQAREGGPDNSKGRSKKWRKLLTFPHISVCAHLADTLPGNSGSEGESGDGDNGYNYIVDQQPLGAKLFKQFCLNHKKGMNNTLRYKIWLLDLLLLISSLVATEICHFFHF